MKLKNYIIPLIFAASSLTSCTNYETQKGKLTNIESIPKTRTHYNCFGDETKKDTTYNYQLTFKVPQDTSEYKVEVSGTWMLNPNFVKEKMSQLEKMGQTQPISFLKRIGNEIYVSDKTHKGKNDFYDLFRLN